MKKYNVIFKEVGKDRVGQTSHTGNLTREEVIEFFGLDKPDVEWYDIEEINETKD